MWNITQKYGHESTIWPPKVKNLKQDDEFICYPIAMYNKTRFYFLKGIFFSVILHKGSSMGVIGSEKKIYLN